MVLFLISAEEFGQAEVGDLHVLRRFHQNVACGQIPVHQMALFQVVHTLKKAAKHNFHKERNDIRDGEQKQQCMQKKFINFLKI